MPVSKYELYRIKTQLNFDSMNMQVMVMHTLSQILNGTEYIFKEWNSVKNILVVRYTFADSE